MPFESKQLGVLLPVIHYSYIRANCLKDTKTLLEIRKEFLAVAKACKTVYFSFFKA